MESSKQKDVAQVTQTFPAHLQADELASKSKFGGPAGQELQSVRGQVELKKVEFAYPERPTITVFKSFDLMVEEGKIVALCGQSGSGKSSIVALVLRFYDPLQGQVTPDRCSPPPPPPTSSSLGG